MKSKIFFIVLALSLAVVLTSASIRIKNSQKIDDFNQKESLRINKIQLEKDNDGDKLPDVNTIFTTHNSTFLEVYVNDTRETGGYKWASAICGNLSFIEKYEHNPATDVWSSTGNLNYDKLVNYGLPSDWCSDYDSKGFILFGAGSGDKKYSLKIPKGRQRFKIYTGSGTEIVEVETSGDAGNDPSLALDSDGNVHIAHYNTTGIIYCNNTNGWSCLDTGSGDVTGQLSLALDSNNKAHISAYNSGNLIYCNNTIGWSCGDPTGSGEDVGRFTSIAIDSNNIPHITFEDRTNIDLEYWNATGWTWAGQTIESADNKGYHSSIAIDTNNKIHISHYDETNDYVRYCNNTVDSFTCKNVLYTNFWDTSLTLDSNNKAHISHYSINDKQLQYCNNTLGDFTCSNISSADSEAAEYTSITLDNKDDVYIIASSVGGNMTYCNNTNGWSCNFIVKKDVEKKGTDRMLAIKQGRLADSTLFSSALHFPFSNSTNHDLYYVNETINTPPSVSLDYPADGSTFSYSKNIYFNFTATDSDGIDTCNLYHNFTGTWHKNYSTPATSGSQEHVIYNLTNGDFIWNVECNDSFGASSFANLNYSLYADSTNPNITINEPTGTKSSLTIDYNVTIKDNSISYCYYNVTRGASAEISNTADNCSNFTGSFSVSSDAIYSFNVFANDTLNNINTTSSTFIVDTSGGGDGDGGGGGGGSIEEDEEEETDSNICVPYTENLNSSWDNFIEEPTWQKFLRLWDDFWNAGFCSSAASILHFNT